MDNRKLFLFVYFVMCMHVTFLRCALTYISMKLMSYTTFYAFLCFYNNKLCKIYGLFPDLSSFSFLCLLRLPTSEFWETGIFSTKELYVVLLLYSYYRFLPTSRPSLVFLLHQPFKPYKTIYDTSRRSWTSEFCRYIEQPPRLRHGSGAEGKNSSLY